MTPAQSTPERQHSWEIVTMSDGRRVKRCRLCLYTFEFGHDLPCPAKSADLLARVAELEKENESAKATIRLLSNHDAVRGLMAGLEDAKASRVTPWEEIEAGGSTLNYAEQKQRIAALEAQLQAVTNERIAELEQRIKTLVSDEGTIEARYAFLEKLAEPEGYKAAGCRGPEGFIAQRIERLEGQLAKIREVVADLHCTDSPGPLFSAGVMEARNLILRNIDAAIAASGKGETNG